MDFTASSDTLTESEILTYTHALILDKKSRFGEEKHSTHLNIYDGECQTLDGGIDGVSDF